MHSWCNNKGDSVRNWSNWCNYKNSILSTGSLVKKHKHINWANNINISICYTRYFIITFFLFKTRYFVYFIQNKVFKKYENLIIQVSAPVSYMPVVCSNIESLNENLHGIYIFFVLYLQKYLHFSAPQRVGFEKICCFLC